MISDVLHNAAAKIDDYLAATDIYGKEGDALYDAIVEMRFAMTEMADKLTGPAGPEHAHERN